MCCLRSASFGASLTVQIKGCFKRHETVILSSGTILLSTPLVSLVMLYEPQGDGRAWPSLSHAIPIPVRGGTHASPAAMPRTSRTPGKERVQSGRKRNSADNSAVSSCYVQVRIASRALPTGCISCFYKLTANSDTSLGVILNRPRQESRYVVIYASHACPKKECGTARLATAQA